MTAAENPRVLHAEVVGVLVAVPGQELIGPAAYQERPDVHAGGVHEGPDLQRVPLVLRPSPGDPGAGFEAERAERGVEDALVSAVAAGQLHPGVSRGVPVRPEVHFGGPGLQSLDRRVGRSRAVGDLADRAGERVRAAEAHAEPVGEGVADGRCVGQGAGEAVSGVHGVSGDVPVERAEPEIEGRARGVARRLRDHVDHPGHGVRAPDHRGGAVHDLDPLQVVQVPGEHAPGNASVLLVHRPAVHHDKLVAGSGDGGGAAGHGVGGVRHPGHVHPRRLPEHVRVVRPGLGLQLCAADHRHRGGRVHDLLLDARRRHHDLVGETGRGRRVLLGLLRLAGPARRFPGALFLPRLLRGARRREQDELQYCGERKEPSPCLASPHDFDVLLGQDGAAAVPDTAGRSERFPAPGVRPGGRVDESDHRPGASR